MGTAISTLNTSAIEKRPTLTPATDRQVFAALEPMFLAYLTDAEKLGLKTVALYVDSVRGEPLWAVNAAIEHIRKGTAPDVNRNFLPKVPAFAAEVRRHSEGMREREARTAAIAADERRVREEYEEGERARLSPISQETRDRLRDLRENALRSMWWA